jgi:hypothetical protein
LTTFYANGRLVNNGGFRQRHVQPFASNVARVSAIAPDSSACSCARYQSRASQFPIHGQHDLGTDAGHRAQIDRGLVAALAAEQE